MVDVLALKDAHAHCIHNRSELKRSKVAGCFFCVSSFPSASITEWVDQAGDTAICPNCGIDSVIGDASGVPVADSGFLAEMKAVWFDGTSDLLIRLYRPVGRAEMDLIEKSGFREFPPRLPEQPIFYPVLNEDYATQIARDWNTREPAGEGFVTQFQVDAGYVSKFDRQVVGSRVHEELWVPAEELLEFNRHIIGVISVIAVFRASPSGEPVRLG